MAKFKRKQYKKPTTLEEAQEIILGMTEELNTCESMFEEHETFRTNSVEEKKKLDTEITRLKNKNLEYFTRLEETFTTEDKKKDTTDNESEVTIDDVISDLI